MYNAMDKEGHHFTVVIEILAVSCTSIASRGYRYETNE